MICGGNPSLVYLGRLQREVRSSASLLGVRVRPKRRQRTPAVLVGIVTKQCTSRYTYFESGLIRSSTNPSDPTQPESIHRTWNIRSAFLISAEQFNFRLGSYIVTNAVEAKASASQLEETRVNSRRRASADPRYATVSVSVPILMQTNSTTLGPSITFLA